MVVNLATCGLRVVAFTIYGNHLSTPLFSRRGPPNNDVFANALYSSRTATCGGGDLNTRGIKLSPLAGLRATYWLYCGHWFLTPYLARYFSCVKKLFARAVPENSAKRAEHILCLQRGR